MSGIAGTTHRPRAKRSASLWRGPTALVGVIIGLAWAVPLLWTLTSSLYPGNSYVRYLSPLSWRTLVPTAFTLENYQTIFTGPFSRALLNSIIVVAATVVVGLAFSTTTAFGLSAIKFKGQGVVFTIVVLSFLVPFDAVSIPLAAVFRDWHLQNSYLGLMLPGIGDGLAIFILRQFFLGIPRELVEAARVDGLGWWGILRRIYLPLCRPALIVAGMSIFFFQWQSYLWPLLMGTSRSYQLAPIALANLDGAYQRNFGAIFAGSVVLILIPALILLRLQRQFIRSLATSGLK
jgi:putative chitobiose transport system permease protein